MKQLHVSGAMKTIQFCAMLAVIAGCAYMPEDDCEFMYPIRESPQYALAPKARWTCLHYDKWSPWGPFPDLRIFPDSHRIQFTLVELGKESPTIKYDCIVTADEWRWIAGQDKLLAAVTGLPVRLEYYDWDWQMLRSVLPAAS